MEKIILPSISPIIDFFVYVEAGFHGEYKHFNSLEDALEEMSYGELYIGYKVDEKTVKELLEEHKNEKTKVRHSK